MDTCLVSFPYRPRFGDTLITALEPLTMASPAALCQSERHMLTAVPASYLEILGNHGAEPGDSVAVHMAWFTCAGCHAQLEAAYGAAVAAGRGEP
jgi:hypothetical protein